MKIAHFAMRSLLLVLLCCIAPVATGTILRIQSVVLALYTQSDTDVIISFETVQFVTALSDPEWRYSALATPYFPPVVGDSKPGDINIVSKYRIAIEAGYAEDNKTMVVTIDATKAVRPEDYPFTIDEVIDAATTCVKLATPPRPAEDGGLKINVKRPKAKAKKRSEDR
jgi:hypothetical protein